MSLAPADVGQPEITAVGVDHAALAAAVTDRYERRGRELWGLARRLGASDEAAHDAVQEAHLRLWRELGRGTVIEDLDAWTFRVLYRLVMDQHRISRKVGEIVGRLWERQPEAATFDADDRLSIWPIVDRLPARERATLYLRYRSDLTFEQIAHVMGISAGGARAYSSRALERLRDVLGTTGEFTR